MTRKSGSFVGIVLGFLGLFFLLSLPTSAQVLSLIEAQVDGVDGVDGIGGPRFTLVSPDGRHVYVAGENENSIAVFERNRIDGTLTFLEAVFDGVDGVEGLSGANALAITPNGRYLYCGAAFGSAVAAFRRNYDGTLDFIEAEFDGEGPVTGLASTVWVSVSSNGRNVYASGFGANSVVVFRRNHDGSLDYLQTLTDGVGGVTGLAGAFGHALSGNGRHLYVTGLVGSAVAIFERNRPDGTLTFLGSITDGVDGVDGIGGARTASLSRNGKHLYVAGLFDSAVAVFRRHRATGELTFIGAEFEGVDGVSGIGFASSAVVSGLGSKVIVSGFGSSAVAVFERDRPSGELTFIENLSGEPSLGGVLYTGASLGGRHLYSAGFNANSVAVIGVDLLQ